MDPIKLFSQYFGKTVPPFMVALFLIYFYARYNECGDVMESLRYAAKKALL